MPKTGCTIDSIRRRRLGAISTAAAAAIVGTGGAAATPADAELIRLCEAFTALELQIQDMPAHSRAEEDTRDAAAEPLSVRQRELMDRMCAVRARTPAGLMARISTLAAFTPEAAIDPGPGPRYWDARILAAIIQDAAALAGRA